MSGDYYLENLLDYTSAGLSNRSNSSPMNICPTVPASAVNLADVGLAVGDIISASADIRNETAAENSRLAISFRDASDGGGSPVGSDTYSAYADYQVLTRHEIENLTIPATTVSILMYVTRESGTGYIAGHKAMINRGATAAAYARPWQGSTYTPMPIWVEGYSRARFRTIDVNSMFEPFGQAPISQAYNAGRSNYWEANLTTMVESARDMRRFCATMNSIGLHGLVAVRDPLHLAPGDDERPAMRDGLVNGSSQAGNSEVITDGWDASTLIIQCGDQFEIGGRFYEATDDVTSDGSGNATISCWPVLDNIADGDVVHVNAPVIHALLLNLPERDYYAANVASKQALAFRENK